jgi:hypothetical protein
MSQRESRPGNTETAPHDLADHHNRNGHEVGGLLATMKAAGGSMKGLTVLANQNDPFRVDTPARHRDGAWLANNLAALGITGQIHIRGLHYILIGQTKPNGSPYTSTDEDWTWLGNHAVKAARWLGYIPFDRIVDERSAEPVIRLRTSQPQPYVSVDFDVIVPGIDDITPLAGIDEFTAAQPYHLVMVGEKSSLAGVLGPVAQRYQADEYWMTGEISDTRAHEMAQSSTDDGRPVVVLYFADCDPSGWQMPISLARKLQALKVIEFGELEFEVHRVGLTPDQVRVHGLPSSPLKDTEKRADDWFDAMDVEQTEIDALATLQPDLLVEIAEDAIAPFYDDTLDDRVRQAMQEWRRLAQQAIDVQSDDDIDQLRDDAADALAEKADEIEQILDTVRVDPDSFDLPDIVIPEAIIDPAIEPPVPLCDSRWSFRGQCVRLIASKGYRPVRFKGKRVGP